MNEDEAEDEAEDDEARDFTGIIEEWIEMDAPQLASLAIASYVIGFVFFSEGLWRGSVSTVLTAICLAPLFRQAMQSMPTTFDESIRSSHILAEASSQELENMRNEEYEYTVVGRMIHRGIENWSQDIEDLVYVAQVLGENQILLLLLVVGISSMMFALVVGFDDVNVIMALFLSVACYILTTVFVARSALGSIPLSDKRQSLSSAEVTRIIEAIHEENFVRNDELMKCDLPCLRMMFNCRKAELQDAVTRTELCSCYYPYCECKSLESEEKTNIVEKLLLRRKYDESCCICLEKFKENDRIRVLSSCQHEFHSQCIDTWLRTFASDRARIYRLVKSGHPCCPLCKAKIE